MPARAKARSPTPDPDAGEGRGASRVGAGRPRDPSVDAAIVAATLDLIAAEGFEGVRIDEVARRAGVSKTTLYRRWEGKLDLVIGALWASPPLEAIDTGDLRQDLVGLMLEFLSLAQDLPLLELLASLAAARQRQPRLAQSLDPFVAERTRPIVRALQRAVARGEIAADTDLDLAAGMFGGPVLLRLLFGGATDRATIERLASQVVIACQRSPA